MTSEASFILFLRLRLPLHRLSYFVSLHFEMQRVKGGQTADCIEAFMI